MVVGAVVAILVTATACSTGGDSRRTSDGTTSADAAASDTGEELTLDDVADIAPSDRRPDLLADLGAPESFVLSVGSVGGIASRFESWQYWSTNTQIDLVDGEIAYDVALAPIPRDSLLPLDYAPDEFVLLSTVDEVRAALPDIELVEIPGAGDDLGLPGATTFASEQLLLAFVDDLLVYVQTFPLVPEAS